MKPFIFKKLLSQTIFCALHIFFLTYNNLLYAEDDRAKRPFARIESSKVGLSIPVPNRPAWNHSIEPRSGTYAFLLSTPEKFYPKVSMEIVLNHRINLDPIKFDTVIISGFNKIRQNSGINKKVTKEELKSITYGYIQGYEDSFQMKFNEMNFTIKSIMGIMPSGHPITIFLAVPEGQIKHIENLSYKIIENIREIPYKES